MDKSFNDQELSDIMKEIEALEEEFSDDSEKIDASSVMEELAEMDLGQSTPVMNKTETVLPFEKKTAPLAAAPTSATCTAPTTMSFKVQGEMNMVLQFEIGGKTIHLDVSETGLNIQMDGGVTFSVPVSAGQSLKKAV